MTLRVHTAEQIRRAVHFTDLIEPIRAALQAYSVGQAADEAQGGLVAVFSSENGHPLAILTDEHYLSDLRTAAAGALAAGTLAADDAATAGVLGTGAQAYRQRCALAQVWPVTRIVVWGRHADLAAKLTRRLMADVPRVEIRTRSTPREVVSESDVVIAATAGTEPLIKPEWLHHGQHITSVGADSTAKCELGPRSSD